MSRWADDRSGGGLKKSSPPVKHSAAAFVFRLEISKMFQKMLRNIAKYDGEVVQDGYWQYIQNRENRKAMLTIEVRNLTIMMF